MNKYKLNKVGLILMKLTSVNKQIKILEPAKKLKGKNSWSHDDYAKVLGRTENIDRLLKVCKLKMKVVLKYNILIIQKCSHR